MNFLSERLWDEAEIKLSMQLPVEITRPNGEYI